MRTGVRARGRLKVRVGVSVRVGVQVKRGVKSPMTPPMMVMPQKTGCASLKIGALLCLTR